MQIIAHNPARLHSFVWMCFAYIGAFFGAWAALGYLQDLDPVWQLAILDVIATLIVFIFSLGFNNSSFYDPYWSVAPPFLLAFWVHPDISPQMDEASRAAWVRIILLAVLTGFWAWRLTFNWARNWQGLRHEDWRYRDFREKTKKWYWLVSFAGFHYFPTLLVFAACLPFMAVVNPRPAEAPLNILDLAASVIMLSAVIIQAVSDEQMFRFRKWGMQSSSEPFTGGLWKYSRHPNYFGECLFWWGVYCFAIAANPEYWWTGIGALGVTALFLFISIPMMEKKHALTKIGYAEYRRSISVLFPRPPRK